MRIRKSIVAVVLAGVQARNNAMETDAQWYVISPMIGCIPTTEPDKFVSAMRMMCGAELDITEGNVNEKMVAYTDLAVPSYSRYILIQGASNCKMTYGFGKSQDGG